MFEHIAYSIISVINMGLLPFYWDLHDNIRKINFILKILVSSGNFGDRESCDMDCEEEGDFPFDLDFDKLQKYLLILLIMTFVLIAFWLLSIISQRKRIQTIFVTSVIATCVVGIVMISELKFVYELLEFILEQSGYEGDTREACLDLTEDLGPFTRIAFCQDYWVYILYYVGYGVMILVASVFGALALRKPNSTTI
jgi:hypothetical protein